MQMVCFLVNFSERHLKYACGQSGVFSMGDFLDLVADFSFSLPCVNVFHKTIQIWTSVAELVQVAVENQGPQVSEGH
jgi:hypothetical protein